MSMRFKIPCLLLILPILASAVEFRAKKTIETEYGNWYDDDGIKEDSGIVVADKISVGFSESHFRGGFEFLYIAKLNRKFGLFGLKDTARKDTALAIISWKDIGFESDKISATLGDFYYTLGQGLIIGMEPMEASGRDRRIQGIKIETKLPWLKMSEIWGVPWEIDRLQKNYNVLNDTSDVLFGFDVSTSLLSNYGISLSGRGLRVEMEDTLFTNLGGIDFEFRHDWISLYLEAAQRSGWSRKLYKSPKKYEEKSGWGMYSSLDTYIGSYGFNFQFMNYDSLSVGGVGYRYNLLPTINQSGYQIDEGKKITCNGIGFQVTGEKTFGDLMLTLSHSEIGNKDTTEAKKIIEYYLRAEFMDFYGLLKFLSLDGVDTHFKERREWEGEIYGSFKDIETTLSVQKVDATSWTTIDSIIPFIDVGLSVEFPIYEIFAMCLDYTRRSKEVLKDAPGLEWYGIGVKIEPSSKVFFEIWGGKEKGGLVCSGGVCRWVNPFDGFKVSLNMTL